MEPKEIGSNYDKLASHWAGPKFNMKNGIAQHERALQFAPAGGRAIDVGCGSSGRIIELMLKHGYAVEGLDVSPGMLKLAAGKHPDVVFHCGDVCGWDFDRVYSFISAWDSIWHVPLDQQRNAYGKVCAALAPGGVAIFTSGGVDVPGENSNPFLGQDLYHAALGIPDLVNLVGECGCILRHLEYDQYPEKHLYLIVQRPAD